MINFGLIDAIDILLVSLLLYYIYRLMKQSSAANIFSGILIFIVVWIIVTQFFHMRLLGTILDKLVNMGALALLILFQEEIRRFFSTIGMHHNGSFLIRFLRGKRNDTQQHEDIMPIVMACMSMSKNKVGALIIIERNVGLSEYISSGDQLNANITQRLIENIFFKNSPLHDGAMIIRNKRIAAAGCILPVSHSTDIPKSLGLRHRAALGISQKTDALSVIVSEETGGISVALNGRFHLAVSADELENILSNPTILS
jgi:diadenylate cyclase